MQAPFRHAKSISLIFGFLFTAIGAVWSLLVIDRLNQGMEQLSGAKNSLTRQLDSLNSIESEYLIANQQGDLIFILAQKRSRVCGVVCSIFGSFLLCANLIAAQDQSKTEAPPAEKSEE